MFLYNQLPAIVQKIVMSVLKGLVLFFNKSSMSSYLLWCLAHNPRPQFSTPLKT